MCRSSWRQDVKAVDRLSRQNSVQERGSLTYDHREPMAAGTGGPPTLTVPDPREEHTHKRRFPDYIAAPHPL